MEEIGSILRNGDIPLIAMDTSTSPSQMEVVRYKEQSEYCNDYVAISHVWSDGLGNPKANSLPRCQLDHIQHLVNKLDPEEAYLVPIWIDTICVPLIPELKSLAILNMDKTYRNATDVLVLDNSWQEVTTTMPAVEIMMRIRYSTWMSRLWTFQEARLSRNLWFQLHNGPVHINDVGAGSNSQETLRKVSDMLLGVDKHEILAHPNRLQLARALAHQSRQTQDSLHRYAVLPKQENEAEEEARLSAIQILSEGYEREAVRSSWHQIIADIDPDNPISDSDGDLQARIRCPDQVVSHAMVTRQLMKGTGGEYAIGKVRPKAIKPGLRPAHHLIDVVRGDRMKVFLSQFEFFPKAMLFWNTPRLQRRGWKWAPSSFLRKDPDIDARWEGGNRGYLTEHGLYVKCPAIRLRTSCLAHESVTRQSTRYNYLTIELAVGEEELHNDPDQANYELRKQREVATVWKWVQLHQTLQWTIPGCANPCIRGRDDVSDSLVILLEEHFKTGMKGALVSTLKTEGQCTWTNHIMTLTALEQKPDQYTLPTVGQWVSESMWYIA
ncbi:MAG: hypothetical protein OHK93_005717 [Ramalina farinacea]|uniref:Heterokaryon incompatibility domain-containing protein n=1 Tax=Ramalina farinacea TaxID=258253 RepID=A0AA43QIQ3_9LECA|nr:hypothetical protein [Ramalina farinacea]